MRCSSWRLRTRSGARRAGDFAPGLAACLGGLVAAGVLHAQSPAQTAALTALRDSLQAVTSADAVQQLPPDWASPAPRAMAELRSALIALRQGELGHRIADLQTAAGRFDDVTRSNPAWSYGWFGRALVKLALAEAEATPKAIAGQRLGEDNYAAFVHDAKEALQRDPVFPPLISFLAAMLSDQGDRAQPAVFIRSLEAAGRLPGADPRIHLVVGRAYRTAHDYANALAGFDRYLAAGGDSGIGQLERARALAGMNRPGDAGTAYASGAESAGPEGRRLYRDDLGWVATPSELASFDSTATDGMGAWLSRFWRMREAAEARAPGERLQEHLRRWVYAYALFRVVHPERRTMFGRVRMMDIGPCSDAKEKVLGDYTLLRPDHLDDYRRREPLLDDRAPIYIRHGEPWQTRRPAGVSSLAEPASARTLDDPDEVPQFISSDADAARAANIRGSNAWLYWFDGAPRVFFFAGSDAFGSGPSSLYAMAPLDPDLLWQLASLDPAYARAASRLQTRAMIGSRATPSSRCDMRVQDMIAHSRADVKAAVTHDSYTLLFRKTLNAVVQTFAVGHVGGGAGRILTSVAIDARGLRPLPRPDGRPGFAYVVTLRIGAVDSSSGAARFVDTVRTFVRSDSLRAGQSLTMLLELPVPAGRYGVRVAVFEPDAVAGMSVQRNVATLSAGMPALSDIVMGLESGGVRWENAGDPVLVNALGSYPEGGTAITYYEIAGLVPGHTYRTTIALRKYEKGKASREGGVSLVFTDVANEPVQHVRRSVDLASLRRGQYQLSVTIQDVAGGAAVSRDQLVNITGR